MAAKRVKFDCISFRQGKHKLVVFVADAKKLWDIVAINTKEEDKDEGYQRVLSPARAKKIAQFIDNDNILPNSILVSFDNATLSNDGRTFSVPNDPNAGWVIDGQHRLAGAHRANKSIKVPVVSFMKLDIGEQIKCFVTINREQKGVPTSLYLDLIRNIPGNKSESELIKARATDIVLSVRKDVDSPFYDRVVVTRAPRSGEISLVNFVRKLSPHMKMDGGRLATFSLQETEKIINNYFRALGHVFTSEFQRTDSVFWKTVGFGALMNALPTFLDITLTQEKGFAVEDAIKTFDKIEDFSFRTFSSYGSGTKAERSAGQDLSTTLVDRASGESKESIRL